MLYLSDELRIVEVSEDDDADVRHTGLVRCGRCEGGVEVD